MYWLIASLDIVNLSDFIVKILAMSRRMEKLYNKFKNAEITRVNFIDYTAILPGT